MARHVDDVAVGCPDEEPPNAPGFGRERMRDLVAPPLGLCKGLVNLGTDMSRDDRILRCSRIPCHQLYRGELFRRGVSGHPAEVELLDLEPHVALVELAC